MKTYGQIVAEKWKEQYFSGGRWDTFTEWPISPKDYYLILRELKSKEAIKAFVGSSWLRCLRKKRKARAGAKEKQDG